MSQLHYQRQTSNVASGTGLQGYCRAIADGVLTIGIIQMEIGRHTGAGTQYQYQAYN